MIGTGTETAAEIALGDWLVERGKLTRAALARAAGLQESSGEPLAAVLVSLGLVPERDVAEALSATLGLSLVTPDEYPAAPVLEDRVSARFLQQARVLPLRDEADVLVLAMANPLDRFALDALRVVAGKPVEPRVAVPADLERAYARLYGGEGTANPLDEAVPHDAGADEDVERLKDLASEAPVIRFVNALIAKAVESRASDIHIEPFESALKIRFRIDGALREAEVPPKRLAAAITSRIKIMAKLNIAERRLPQDGRIKVTIRGRDIDLRVSTLPTMHGESVVLRVLDRSSVTLDFQGLGFGGEELEVWRGILHRPNGIVLVTGPTGSGKTTTLYASLVEINTPDRKIFTVEDPIEYHLEGINQIQVKPQIGLTFAHILRAILRQDPDVIMVGEIRDKETADIAMQAALTGHLVLSTLHTNDAAGTVTRLLDMGVEDYLLTATVNAIVAQRLVRRLCPHCREPYEVLPEMADHLGLPRAAQLHRAKGCARCHGTGYHGRTSILEVLVMTDAVRASILRKADAREVARAAAGEGMRSLQDQGLRRALEGVTTVEEVLRVTRSA